MSILYLSIAALVSTIVTAFYVNYSRPSSVPENLVVSEVKAVSSNKKIDMNPKWLLSKVPVLGENKSFPVISAQGAIAIDVDSGVYLYEKNKDAKLLPASTTKILTAMVAIEEGGLEEAVKIPEIKVDGQKMKLLVNEVVNKKDLIRGLLIFSANDAAETLALTSKVGKEKFVEKMNEIAYKFGARNSNFVNPTGLDEKFQYTSAKDLAHISIESMKNSVFSEIVATKKYDVLSTDQKFKHSLYNLNELLGEYGVIGVKTGWTENARENLVVYLVRENREICIVVLGSDNRFEDTKTLINWIFDSYSWKSLAYSSQ